MQRALMKNLLVWKYDLERKPLVLRGARRVGKTWLLREFGSQEFKHTAYVNLENNATMQNLFRGSLEPQRLLDGISSYTDVPISKNTLVILDEIQSIPQSLTALKHLAEDTSGCAIVATGSLMGIALQARNFFPAGAITLFDLYPLTFSEFLSAKEYDSLSRYIEEKDFRMLDVHAEQFKDLLYQYLFVGGMPEAVAEHIKTNDSTKTRIAQKTLLDVYEKDFEQYALRGLGNRCQQIWRSVPNQLIKENKKFMYGDIRKGARGRDYEKALQLLEDSGLIYRVWRVENPGVPLEHHKDTHAFKVFFVDVGLLGALFELDGKTMSFEKDFLSQQYEDAYTEQFVCQELKAECGYYPYYWSAPKSAGVVDFLFQNSGKVYPCEVNMNKNPKRKSLATFCKKHNLPGIRLTLNDYKDEGWVKNIPLYAVGTLSGKIL